MIAVAHREAVKALPAPLRKLLETAAVTADQIDERRSRHEQSHGCKWLVGLEWPEDIGPDRPFCVVDQILFDAWHPLYVFARCLEYFLVGGRIPAGAHGELMPLCSESECTRPIWASGPRCKECVDGIVDRNARLGELVEQMGPTR